MTPDPASIKSGDKVTITTTVSGDDGANLEVGYSINKKYNLYFDLPGGAVQVLPAEKILLNNPPMPIVKKVTIVKKPPIPPNGDFTTFQIRVDITDGNTSDFKNATIQIP